MSYSSLILNDSPECVWSLEETSGTSVNPFAFILDESYVGEYKSEKFLRSQVPIVYSGKTSICNNGSFTGPANYSTSNVMFDIPSIGKFSSATRNKSYTLEFWMNLDFDPSSLLSGASSRTGESQIVQITGNSISGLYIRDLDYLVFKVGDTGFKAVESSIHIESFNNPLHVMLVYTPFSVQIFVNGIAGSIGNINENIFGDEETRKINFLFPDKISSSSAHFDNISYDSVAMYSQPLNDLIAKRHYVYGLGYDVPKYTIKSIGGIQYETNMQLTLPERQINYLDYDSWSSRVSLSNLQYASQNLSTITYNNQSLYIASEDITKNTSDMITNDGIIFPSDSYSYLEVSNYESITEGTTKKLEAKFSLLSEHATTGEQQLMFIGSKSISGKYISFVITDRTISVRYKFSDNEEQDLMTYTLNSLANSFFLSLAKSSGTISVSIFDDTNNGDTDSFNDINIFPLQDSFIRFGSFPLFFGSALPSNYSLSSVGRFDGALNQVDISNSTSTTSSWSSYPSQKISSLYQLYSNNQTKKLCVATSGTFSLNLSLIDLMGLGYYDKTVSEIALAPKVEVGSSSAEVKYDLKSIVGETVTVHEDNIDFRRLKLPSGITSSIKSQELQYVISGTLRSTDVFNAPGVLEYLRVYTYPVQVESSRNYIEVNDTAPGTNLKYFSGYSSSTNHPFIQLPELEKTSEMHRSFKTGTFVGTHGSFNPYVKVTPGVLGITTESTPKIYAVFFNARNIEGLSSAMELLRTSAYTVNWTTPEPSGIQMYVNGTRWSSGGTYNQSLWNNYCIKFTSGIAYDSDIFFGYSGSGWTIDNLSIIMSDVSSTKINELYTKMFGQQINRFPDNQDENVFNVLIRDQEYSDGQIIYQPLSDQSGFLSRSLCPRLASTSNVNISNVSGSDFVINYNGNRDLISIDGFEILNGDRILLKNQSTESNNGIYLVTSKSTTQLFLTKQTSVSDNTVIFVISGNENKNYYFKKFSNSYTKTQTQKKIVSYDNSSGFSHTVTVRNTT
jgi:hypothetical protein